MIKIPTVFKVDYTNPRNGVITREVTPGCEWVLEGEGVAYRKWDGTAVLIRDGRVYKRYDAKHGKTPPPGFEPAQDPDPVTGHWPGWLEVNVNNPDPSDVYIALAYWQTLRDFKTGYTFDDGTYEAIGPRINSNKERVDQYFLINHVGGFNYNFLINYVGGFNYMPTTRSFDQIRAMLEKCSIEGLVFWREPGKPEAGMAKIRRDHFNLPWPVKS